MWYDWWNNYGVVAGEEIVFIISCRIKRTVFQEYFKYPSTHWEVSAKIDQKKKDTWLPG